MQHRGRGTDVGKHQHHNEVEANTEDVHHGGANLFRNVLSALNAHAWEVDTTAQLEHTERQKNQGVVLQLHAECELARFVLQPTTLHAQ